MPLPFIIGGIVLGAIIGAVVILSLKEFFEEIKKRKEKKKAEAKINDLYPKGDYMEVDVGLYANGRKVDSETYQVDKDDARKELRKGMTL